MTSSIRKQLLLWLLVPLIILWAINLLVAYNLSLTLAREIFDRQLLNSADSVINRINFHGSEVTIDLPPAVLTVLRHNYRDKFYFQILRLDGKRLAGDIEIPYDEKDAAVHQPVFKTVTVNGTELRVMTIRVPTQENAGEHVMVQVAETRNARHEFVTRTVGIVALTQLLLIACGAVTVWYGIQRGLRPLTGLQHALSRRSPTDLSPFPEELSPVETRSLLLEINDLLSRIRDDIDRQQRFIANAAHQLRTPLAGLKTYADLSLKLSDDNKMNSQEMRSALSQMHAGIGRMSHLVHQLLMLARLEPTAVASQNPHIAVDLTSIVSDTTEEMVPLSIKRSIDLGFESTEGRVTVEADAAALKEMVTNLIENALLYTPEGGTVTVSVLDNGSPSIVVEDTGPGIPETEREKVFERFYRLHAGEPAGSGLGLSIVKEIADAHRATIEIGDGRSGKGARITVKF